jgi:hypothetical protein
MYSKARKVSDRFGFIQVYKILFIRGMKMAFRMCVAALLLYQFLKKIEWLPEKQMDKPLHLRQ